MANLKNFDELNEQKEAYRVFVGGRWVEAPKVFSARKTMAFQRKSREVKTENESLDLLMELGEDMLGTENFSHLDENLDLKGITEVIEDLMVYYGMRDPEVAEVEGEAGGKEEVPPEESPSTPSSPTGESSTPTSNVFGLVPGSITTLETSPGLNSSVG